MSTAVAHQTYPDATTRPYGGTPVQESLSNTQTAADQLKHDASAKLDEATQQGHHDVQQAESAAASYLGTAKDYTERGLGAAHDAIHNVAAAIAPAPNATGVLATVKSTAANALEATSGYLASAQATLHGSQPAEANIESAKQTATNATAAVQNVAQNAANSVAGAAASVSNTVSNTLSSTNNSGATSGDAAKDIVGKAAGLANSAQQSAQPAIQTTQSAAVTAKDAAANAASIASAKIDEAKASAPPTNSNATVGEKAAPYVQAARETVAEVRNTTSTSSKPAPYTSKSELDDLSARADSLKLGAAEGVQGVLQYGEQKLETVKPRN